MLKVDLRAEPADFDAKVRQTGLQWFTQNGVDMNMPLPAGAEPPNYWIRCLDDLRQAFDRRCCYSCSYMRKSEVIPVEHALPKKLRPDLAYEWANYRYASSRINSRKGMKIVLDPACFPVGLDIFHMEFVDGAIFPNPALHKIDRSLYKAAENTISDLGLDDGLYRDERMEIWDDYLSSSRGRPEIERLKKTNTFVWYEADRQGLL